MLLLFSILISLNKKLLMTDILKNDKPFYSHKIIDSCLEVFYVDSVRKVNTFADDVRIGLTAEKKYLLPKYFYDEKGSELFEKICKTNEYYVTRAESEILKKYSDEIASVNSDKSEIVELGSGSSVKTRYIIDSFLKNHKKLHYLPIDVSDIMISSAKYLIEETTGLKVSGFISEYEQGLSLIKELFHAPKLILFLGSSIGNFDFVNSVKFVSFIGSKMNKTDSLLIGFDMKKNPDILNAAYNDSEGVTAEFNLNLLERINNELDGNFDLSKFEHRAFFNEEHSRIEMHLVSIEEQEVCIKSFGKSIQFKKGEDIYTESSYKFTNDMISDIAWFSNMRISNIWRDEKGYFSLCLFKPL